MQSSLKRALADLKAGDAVWLNRLSPQPYMGIYDLLKVQHICPKGRLFVGHSSLWKFAEFGFDPKTGLSPRYRGSMLSAPSEDDLALYGEIVRRRDLVYQQRLRKARLLQAAQEAAPQLLEACKRAERWPGTRENEPLLEELRAAIRASEPNID